MFPVCQHQGAGGQLWLATELAGANLWIETPNESRRHWWGELPPEDQPPAPNIAVLSTIPSAEYADEKYIGGDHAGFWGAHDCLLTTVLAGLRFQTNGTVLLRCRDQRHPRLLRARRRPVRAQPRGHAVVRARGAVAPPDRSRGRRGVGP